MSNQVRESSRIVSAHRQREGGGFIVRRPLPSAGLELADPFLLLDEMGPANYKPGEAVGAPDHPHRGFETVTYMLDGEFEHEDSAGHRGVIRPGDVQWMTAGAGVVHSEMPSKRIREQGGRVHGFQIWVNLPARMKLRPPRYQEIPAGRIPEAQNDDGSARVRVIAGAALGIRAVIDTHTPIVYQDWTLGAAADVTVSLAADHDALVYVFGGAARVGNASTEVLDGQMALLGPGDAVRLRGTVTAGPAQPGEPAATAPARLLLLGGVPIGEPVARYGPFVMNTHEELQRAFRDYRSGAMGQIQRNAGS